MAARKPKKVKRQWDMADLLARMENAGFTQITTRAGAIYFVDADGEAGCFPYTVADASRGTDYLVAGPGSGQKLTDAYEAGTAIINQYALVRLAGIYKAHPLVEPE